MTNVTIDASGVWSIRLNRNDCETVMIDQSARNSGPSPIEFGRAVRRLAKEYQFCAAKPIKHSTEFNGAFRRRKCFSNVAQGLDELAIRTCAALRRIKEICHQSPIYRNVSVTLRETSLELGLTFWSQFKTSKNVRNVFVSKLPKVGIETTNAAERFEIGQEDDVIDLTAQLLEGVS